MIYPIKIYGMRRSGTNFLKWILERNYNLTVIAKNKHRTPEYYAGALDYVSIMKNPFSWIASILRSNYYKKADIKGLIEAWNKDNWMFLKFITKVKGVIIRYEDFFETNAYNVEKATQVFEEKHYPVHRNSMFVIANGIVGTNQKVTPRKAFDRDYYSQQRYLNVFTDKQMREVGMNVDIGLLYDLGYVHHWNDKATRVTKITLRGNL